MQKSKILILCYHGVIKKKVVGLNSSGKHLDYKEFVKQINFCKKNFNIISINQLINKNISKTKVNLVITFDDGYHNVFSNAYPFLKKNNIPMTFYVTSGFIDGLLPWTDWIEALIFFTNKKKISKNKFLSNFTIKSIHQKKVAFKKIKNFCKTLNHVDKDYLLRILEKELFVKKCKTELKKNKELFKFCTWKQLYKMSRDKLVTIGGHSQSHEILTKIPLSKAQKEIKTSLKRLSQNKIKTNLFAYPNGQKGDFNNKIISLLKKQNIICCPSAMSGYNNINTNLFKLKRIMIGFENLKFETIKEYNY